MVVYDKKIEEYLKEIKKMINENKCIIARKNRDANNDLFFYYVIDEYDVKEILLGLEVKDFVEVRQNEHVNYKHEKLYIFGKEVQLLERFGGDEKVVPLYIKLNKVDETLVIVVSFHVQKRPLKYYFK